LKNGSKARPHPGPLPQEREKAREQGAEGLGGAFGGRFVFESGSKLHALQTLREVGCRNLA